MAKVKTVGEFVAELQQYPDHAEVHVSWRTGWHSNTTDHPEIVAASEFYIRQKEETSEMLRSRKESDFAKGGTGFPFIWVNGKKKKTLEAFTWAQLVNAMYRFRVINSASAQGVESFEELADFLAMLLDPTHFLHEVQIMPQLNNMVRETLEDVLTSHFGPLEVAEKVEALLQPKWYLQILQVPGEVQREAQ